jgi:hypothetical protein
MKINQFTSWGEAVSKSRLFFFTAVVVAVATVVGGLAFGGDLPTQAEAWDTVRSDGFGPAIGVDNVTIDSDFAWWLNWGESKVVDAYASEDGKYFFVVYRAPAMISFTYGDNKAKDNTWRVVYGVQDKRIVPIRRQMGDIIEESYKFEPLE